MPISRTCIPSCARTGFASLTLGLAAVCPAVMAGSSTSSAASDAGSASLGSSAASFARSSESSVTRDVAAGDYEVVDVTTAGAPMGHTRLRLQPLSGGAADSSPPGSAVAQDPRAPSEPLNFFLPQPTARMASLAVGDVITARSRPYGLEWSRRNASEPFFLVLTDDWFRELQTRPL